MKLPNIVGIIADDLTGANDTALQFKKCIAETKILINQTSAPENDLNTEVWAISSESRNVEPEIAKEKVREAIKTLNANLNLEHFYKKIDSTMRGNIAVETLVMVEELGYDVAIIIPAFPPESRITVGGYHLCKGVPIGRTEIARDPHSPITESHIPTLFKAQLGEKNADLVATLDLKTIMNGAGPILVKINELIKLGKKLIIADAVTTVDIEQMSGYPDVLENQAFLADILNNLSVSINAHQISVRTLGDKAEWNYVLTQKDADAFMEIFAGFHDSTIERINYSETNGTSIANIIFDNSGWFGVVELCFEATQMLKIIPAAENYSRELYEASLIVEKESIFWADSYMEHPNDSYEGSIIKALNLKWRKL